MRHTTRMALCAAVAASAVVIVANPSRAASYASGVSESGGNVSFVLNEDADNVIVYRDGVATSLGAQSKGTVSFSRDGASQWQIQVVKAGGLGYTTQTGTNAGGALQIFADTNNTRFFNPRGVAVNTSTADLANFGRFYVANANGGASTASGTLTARTTTDGLYVLGADASDVTGQGDSAKTGGLSWSASTSASPYDLAVGVDGKLYISDWSDTNGSVFIADANVSSASNLLTGLGGTGTSIPAGNNHGSIAGVAVSGSLATGDLKVYVIDEDFGGSGKWQAAYRHDVNSGPTATAEPTFLANPLIGTTNGVTAGLTRGPDGKLYLFQNRSTGNENGIVVYDEATNTAVWSSRQATIDAQLDADSATAGTQDLLRMTRGVAISPDGKYMAVVRDDGQTWLLTLTNGVPDLASRTLIPTFTTGSTTGRDVAFDAAGNLYVTTSSSTTAGAAGVGAVRVFSPGGVSITTLSSDGTFTTQSASASEWLNASSGSAGDSSNWALGVVPNGTGVFAKFGSAAAAPATVTLPGATTLGAVMFSNANAYTVSGGSLTLNSPTFQTAPTVYVTAGSHTIQSPVTLSRSSTVSVAAGSTLTLSGGISGNAGLTSNSAGTLEIASQAAVNALTVRGNGTVKFTGADASKVVSISTFTTGGTPPVNTFTGTVDLTNSKLVVNYTGTSTIDNIRTQLAAGYNGGNWAGKGVTSSTAAADGQQIHGLGYIESTSLLGASGGTWFNQSADATAILIAYTFKGDANLDLAINGDDFALLDKGYLAYTAGTLAAGTAHYSDGDFDYDGDVDSTDFLTLDTTKGKIDGVLSADLLAARGAQFGGEYVSQLVAAVPEPTTLGLLAATIPMAARRRRK